MKIELLLFSVEHPECRVSSNIQKKRSGGAPSILWNGSIINLMELIASLDYSGFITNDNGSRQSFAGLVAAFEELVFPTIRSACRPLKTQEKPLRPASETQGEL